MSQPSAHVRVPATSANLGPGFDTLGLALGWYDDARAVVTGTAGLVIDVVGVGAGTVARDERHLVVRAMDAAFAALGRRRPGLALRCENRIPHASGLGSSAAAAVSGVLLARALAGEDGARLTDAVALALAAQLEGHPDNAAAALLGGATIAWQDGPGGPGGGEAVHAVRLVPHESLAAAVLVPDTTLATERARGMLPTRVPHADAAHAAGRAALLVHALTTDPGLLLPATEDRLHQDYRAGAMPDTIALLRRLRGRGLAAVVSGAGPSILVLGAHDVDPEAIRHATQGWSARRVVLDHGGGRLTTPRRGPARASG